MKTFKKLAEYLRVKINESQLEKLVDFVAFENFKKNSRLNEKARMYGGTNDIEFVRKGQIGNWKEHLSPEMSMRIDTVVKKKLKYNKTFKYEPSFKKL
jgi:estrone sulfotransferase